MMWEHRVLGRRQRRELEDVDAPAPIDDGDPSPDPLVPLGYDKQDTLGSLGLLLGSIVVGLALDSTYQKISHRLYSRRIANFGRGRSAFFTAFVMWDFL